MGTARGNWFKDSWGITGLGVVAIVVAIMLAIGGTIGGLYAAGVFHGNPFTCPKGETAYVQYYIYVPVSTGRVTTIVPIPVMGCETQ